MLISLSDMCLACKAGHAPTYVPVGLRRRVDQKDNGGELAFQKRSHFGEWIGCGSWKVGLPTAV
jgi:hypothetical protein